MKAWLFIILGAVFLAGCMEEKTFGGNINDSLNEVDAKTACIQRCIMQLTSHVDLNNGPCISNEITKDWVCDVAHNPRLPVDDDPANQCSEFGKSAHHFVEVDPNCNFIREGD